MMKLIDCDSERLDAIREILNHEIATSTALWEERPRSRERIAEWYASKQRGNRPVIGAADAEDRLLGFATYGDFRSFPGYQYTVEHSVYVAADARRSGVGRALVDELIARARQAGLRRMVGVIDAANTPSRRLHESLGFVHSGSLEGIGRKFDRWLDVCFYLKRLVD